MPTRKKIAVVGGGIAGLAATYELAKRQREGAPIDIALFEASDRLGGTVETVRHDGFLIECGPDAWVTEKPWARELAVELGLDDQLLPSNDATRRTYLAQNGSLVAMPEGLRMMVPSNWAPLLASPLLSAQAKLAYLREPKRAAELKDWAAAHPEDESVGSMIRRHFGEEVAAKLAAPLLSGVFGGDIERLSAQAVMAPFVAMAREHGSLIHAVQQRARAWEQDTKHDAKEGKTIFTTLRDGVGALIDAMAATLPPGIVRLRELVSHLKPTDEGWSLRTRELEQQFDQVILATPAHIAREFLTAFDAASAQLLEMEASSAIIVALGFAPDAAARMRLPGGFGFLVPQTQTGSIASYDPSLLAATFVEQKFAGRVPAGGKLIRAFFGGRNAPQLLQRTDAELVELARKGLQSLLGPLPQAAVQLVRRWPNSLPQYAVGHLDRMDLLDAGIAALPGLRLIGNAYRGVGLPDLIRQGRTAARLAANG